MRALSIRQPWAWAIVEGHKDIENRSWRTRQRGPLLIHASAKYDHGGYEFIITRFPALTVPTWQDAECGGIVGVAHITDCVSAHPSRWFTGPFGFVIDRAAPLPFRAGKGAQGYFDGQHRATAALLHPAIEAVPCWITQASLEEQARAFVAINSAVTRMTSMQMFHAAVASGDGLHVKAAAACQAAGVTVLRYPLQADKMKLGETLAAGALVHCARRFPQAVLTLALTALKTQDAALDVPGHVNATTIKALCTLIDRLDWQHKSEAILATLSAQPIAELWDEASMDARTHGGGEAARLTTLLAELDEFKCLFARAAKRGTGSY